MLRVHFTADDLTRTRIAAVGPVDETACAIWLLQRPESAVFFEGWRERTRAQLEPAARMLGALIPAARCISLDLFTLSGGPAHSLDQALENLRACPADDLRVEARYADRARPLRSWAAGLTAADAEARDLLDSSLRAAYDSCVAPYWTRINAHYAARRSAYARAFVEGGVHQLLRSLHPSIRWDPPILELPTPSTIVRDPDRYLDGRGVVLAPAFFDLEPRMTWDLADEAAPPVLHLPPADAQDRLETIWPATASGVLGARLAALLGRTRAQVLETIANGCTTSELARSLGISNASASEHATVLRAAGLVASRRHRNAVHHSLTPIGVSLVNHG
ncbi:ArsR/SmtB family transcription factor [Jidongwangia harbinensis]|uniref:ArsR/SmtB family transcription factor n=1 Tax=Jidongwangia harbinensis TaxID=2878561 RepID=UPI001CD9C43D|nr:winged helix-turn-helix domain-containing protein [Jidongwangia harbinensis]MCA2211399.1 winged helix-turn-helix domain-containing protein [Jidongwangia harbinensis]